MRTKADVVIIGGGILGCSVAFYLSRKGIVDTVLIEMGQIGSGETSRTAAMVMHQTGVPLITRLAKISIEEYHWYEEEFGAPVSFRQVGSILYTTDPEKADDIETLATRQCELGVPTVVLTSSDIQKHAPMVSTKDIVIGAYCSLDGYIDPSSVMDFYCRCARDKGVEINRNIKALGIKTKRGRVIGVKTTSGYIETHTVINAAGAMASLLGEKIGLQLPIKCDKRHLVVVKPPSPINTFPILEDVVSKWYFRPEGSDVLIGVGPVSAVSIEDEPEFFLPAKEQKILEEVAAYVQQRAPTLFDGHVEDYWAGIRSLSDDGLPILGPVNSIDRFINCCGLSGFGITNAPVCGKLVAELIADGQSATMPLAEFLLSRFR